SRRLSLGNMVANYQNPIDGRSENFSSFVNVNSFCGMSWALRSLHSSFKKWASITRPTGSQRQCGSERCFSSVRTKYHVTSTPTLERWVLTYSDGTCRIRRFPGFSSDIQMPDDVYLSTTLKTPIDRDSP